MDIAWQLETLISALKRLLIDGGYVCEDGNYQKIISRQDTEEARDNGELEMFLSPDGSLVCRLVSYHAGG